jgi:hypothetical protein
VNIDRTNGALVVAIALALAASASCRRAETEQTTQVQPAPQVAGNQFDIRLDTSGPLKMKAAPLDVTVRENGRPAAGLDVSVELRMPPAGAMGEMRTGAFLAPAGDGHYRGQVDMMMAGEWNAIVRVKRNGEVVATHTQPVTAE